LSSRPVQFSILLISDGFDERTGARVDAALAALPAGVAAVQLRAKALAGRALYQAATALATIVHGHGGLLLVNDRADVAVAAGADGVHLPARGLPPAAARAVVGETRLVGVSTHTAAEAAAACANGADYVTFGPVFDTPGAEKAPPVGLATLAEVTRATRLPLFALGGVAGSRARQAVGAGARVACIRAVLGRDDAGHAARSLLSAMY
jgi:thiamine-phosphate pyrophosphorylase